MMAAHTNTSFTEKAKAVHNGKYEYIGDYVNARTKINILCNTHGNFTQTPDNHLQGKGCPLCGKERTRDSKKYSREEWVCKASAAHKGCYTYHNVEYKGCAIKVSITCKVHGDFTQSPVDHLLGRGCPNCNSMGYSNIAIKWLEEHLNLGGTLLHYLSGGEFRIPGTRYRVDGFIQESSTVLEFLGDPWHGNPYRYKLDDYCNPYDKTKTAGQLYEETMTRLKHIHSLGYTVIYIWESEYRKGLPETIIKKEDLWQ